jgi:hypothetical protein
VIVSFVDIGGIFNIDNHCLNFLLHTAKFLMLLIDT